jgi:hypothetical protein
MPSTSRIRGAVCAALIALVIFIPSVPAAGARPAPRPDPVARQASIAEGVATAIAAEIVKAGVKAAVAQWAPDLTKYVDSTGHSLAQIQAQLEEISRKLSELLDQQQAAEQHLNCVAQRVALDPVLSRTEAWFGALRGAARITTLSDRDEVFKRLYSQYDAMVSDQNHLHRALAGSDGLIRACAKHIETGMKPYLSAALARDVDSFYGVYRTAASELLILRANMIALHEGHFPSSEAKDVAAQLESRWRTERSWIKPAFPSSMSYDVRSGWLWRYTTIARSDSSLIAQLERSDWHVTGRSTIPTCSAVAAYVKASGRSGAAALNYVRQLQVLNIPAGDTILCYDDHDKLRDYNLARDFETYAGDYISNKPSVAARPNDGLVNVGDYSYLSG